MRVNHLAIIGFGPRGLNVLDRIIENVNNDVIQDPIHLHIINPGNPGQGSHPAEQPEHLLVNTVSSQITLFAGNSQALKAGGESFIQWAKTAGYRRDNDTFTQNGVGAELTDMEYLPRSLLGEYLTDYYQRLLKLLPENITITEYRQFAVNLTKDERFTVTLQDGKRIACDFVFLTTGHGYRKPTHSDSHFSAFCERHRDRNPLLAYHASPYPVKRLDTLSAKCLVLIQGFGLTAHDTISALTLGRGGRYIKSGDGLEYIASGREPEIVLSSRQCLPFAGRGINQKGLIGRHTGQFLTPAVVEAIAASNIAERNSKQIDFQSQILPLLIKEMAYAWQCALMQTRLDPDTFSADEHVVAQIEQVLWPLRNRTFDDYPSWCAFFLEMVNHDLQQAKSGNMNSPLKAATDVLRDVREALRRAVEWNGLTPESHRYFIESFNPIINRISFGPPLRRNQELLALFAAGVVTLGGGPATRIVCDENQSRFVLRGQFTRQNYQSPVDAIIIARLDAYSPLTDGSELTRNLLRNGLITPYMNGDYHPGGMAVDRELHPINASGVADENLWAIGFPVEGPHYYTHALPRPHLPSRQFEDANISVKSCLRRLVRQEYPLTTPVEASA